MEHRTGASNANVDTVAYWGAERIGLLHTAR
jgi:hypothetical protein